MNDLKDKNIIQMLQTRNERAIEAAQEKYRGFAMSILSNLLEFKEDREECMNDAFLKLWNSIPPAEPESLSAYLAEILRNEALMRTRRENAWKRGGKVLTVGEEFLSDITDGRTLADDYESELAGKILSDFLRSQPKESRKIFIIYSPRADDIHARGVMIYNAYGIDDIPSLCDG